MRQFSIFLFLFFINFCVQAQSLFIDVSDIKQEKGEIKLALYNQPDGFPFETTKAFKLLKSKPIDGNVKFVVETLKPGRYAIALFQDTNNDGILNVNFIGVPKEGYGVSNNAYNTFSAPKYADASFDHSKTTIQKIIMKY